MKRFISTVTALGLLAAAPAAFAQPEHRGEHQGPGAGRPAPAAGQAHAPGHPSGARGPGPAANPPRGAVRGEAMRRAPPDRGPAAPNAGPRRESPAMRSPRGIAPGPGFAPGHAPARGTGGPQRRSADIARLRGNVPSARHFHAAPYRPPRGFAVRRFRFGERLPHAFFVRRFWITDFGLFGLFPPPPGYVWVRVGPDALLIDEFTGEIVRVEYGVFY